jgi:ABC-type spermidine/putrescine transport system permease subunit I
MAWFIAPAVLMLLAFFAAPVLLVVATSFGFPTLTFDNYMEIGRDGLYVTVMLTTLQISAMSTLLALLLGYPVAYHLARMPARRRSFFMMLVLLPFWTSILVKSFAFAVVLGNSGILNSLVVAAFGESFRMPLLFNRLGVLIGMSHYLLPFMVLAILNSLLALDPQLKRAAEMVGAGKLRIFLKITLPLSATGITAGCLMCFILSLGMFITPALLGGRSDLMISSVIEFSVRETLNWGLASALGVVLVIITAALMGLMSLARARDRALGASN